MGCRYKLPGVGGLEGDQGAPKCFIRSSFSIEADIIRWSSVILTVLAASNHLAYDAGYVHSLIFLTPATLSYSTEG